MELQKIKVEYMKNRVKFIDELLRIKLTQQKR